MDSLTIGKLAKLTGINTETIRYYERRKLIPRPPSSSSGYRQYGDKDVSRLIFIRRCLRLGLNLDEIKLLLEGHVQNTQAGVPSLKNTLASLADRKLDIEHLHDALNNMLSNASEGTEDIVDHLMQFQRWQECPEESD